MESASVARTGRSLSAARLCGMSIRRPERDAALIARLKALGEQYPPYGYLLLHAMLRAEGLVKNRKRTYRVYTQLGLQVRTKRRKKVDSTPDTVIGPVARQRAVVHRFHSRPAC